MRLLIWLRYILLITINVVILTTIFSCQSITYALSPQKIDPELRPYINTIVSEAKDHGYDLDISILSAHIVWFSDSHTIEDGKRLTVIGMCYPSYFLGDPYIVILPETWEQMSTSKREALVFHEFFHCIMGADHTSDMAQMRDGSIIEASLMSPVIPSAYTYWRYRRYYIEELFKFQVDKDTVKHFLKKDKP